MCSAPTITDVVMWIYEKHDIWIEVILEHPNYFGYNAYRVKDCVCLIEDSISYNSPTEAL